MLLIDLAHACRKSGLRVVELPGWQKRGRPASTGDFDPRGILCHHTGASADDRAYVEWMTYRGRADLPAPLCQLALDRSGTVYVCAAGRANHAGTAKASGPMPAGDGNELYIGIEALNDGSEGWTATQGEAYARLCAALCKYYGWPATHVRAHRETSTTGKWDPGLLDMDEHRARVTTLMEDNDMTPEQDKMLREIHRVTFASRERERNIRRRLGAVLRGLDELADASKDDATKKQAKRIRADIAALADEQESESPAGA